MLVKAPNDSNNFMTFAWYRINETGAAASQERDLLADFDNLLLAALQNCFFLNNIFLNKGNQWIN